MVAGAFPFPSELSLELPVDASFLVESPSLELSLLELLNFAGFVSVTTLRAGLVASGDSNDVCFFLDLLFLRDLVGGDAVAAESI